MVVPLIEAEGSDDDGTETPPGADDDAAAPTGVGSAEAEAERLGKLLAPLRVGMVHGRLKAADRDAVMSRFRDGDLDVLVGTTVVEVGVDVPAGDDDDHRERRPVRPRPAAPAAGPGRSWHATSPTACSCRDAPEDSRGDGRGCAPSQRTTDGFELAELDIALRQEGELLGLRQSGLPPLRVARLADPRHRELSLVARQHAERLVGADGRLLDGHERAGARADHAAGWRASVRATCSPRTSSMADAGRVIGGTRRRPAAAGTRATGTRPFGDRVKQALFGALETDPASRSAGPSWTCSPAAAPRASRRSAGAPRRPCSWSTMRARRG